MAGNRRYDARAGFVVPGGGGGGGAVNSVNGRAGDVVLVANDILPGWYNVKSFGAVGDGVTDDTAAIIATIAAATANGGVVYFPPGTYLNTGFTVPSRVTLEGFSWASCLKAKSTIATDMITPSANTQFWFKIKSLRLDGNKAAVGATVRAINVDFTGFGAGDKQILCDDLYINDWTGDGFRVGVDCRAGEFSNFYIINCNGHGMVVSGSDNSFYNVSVGNSGQNGWEFTGSATDSLLSNCRGWQSGQINSATAGDGFHYNSVKGVKLSGCAAFDNLRHGNHIENSQDISIDCDYDSNHGDCVHLTGTTTDCAVRGVVWNSARATPTAAVAFSGTTPFRNTVVLTVDDGIFSASTNMVTGTVTRNAILIGDLGGVELIDYAATISVDPYHGDTKRVGVLTGNITVGNPARKHEGQRLTFLFTQDATGGRTITFDTNYHVVDFAPDLTANGVSAITFICTQTGTFTQISKATPVSTIQIAESQVTGLVSDLAGIATSLAAKLIRMTRTAVKTATTYTAAANELVPVDTTSNSVTITLPNAPVEGTTVGIRHIIRGGTNTITVNTAGSDVFSRTSGPTTAAITLPGQTLILLYDHANGIWTPVSDDSPLSQLDLRFANLVSPTFTGNPLAPTPTSTDNDTSIATTAFVRSAQRPYAFAQGSVAQAIPNNVFTPIGLDTNQADTDTIHVLNNSSTTVAAGSNGVALPTGTINVASAAGFPTSGYLLINGPPGASTTTIVKYTGGNGSSVGGIFTSGTTFTGCTLGTGTMATGQSVTPANETFTPVTLGLYIATAQVSWAVNATGNREIRLVDNGLPVGSLSVPTTNVANQNVPVPGQPLFNAGGQVLHVEVRQTSGGVLNAVKDGIQAPTLGLAYIGGV